MSGFPSPNYTQTPNDFFAMLPDMNEAEVRVTLVMIRQTFGYHRDDFKMGVTKLAKAAGLSRQGTLDGAKAAESRGTFRRTNPDEQGEAEWELIVPLHEVDTPLQPVEGNPPASGGQVGVKERIKKELKKGDLLDAELHYHLKPKSIQDAIKTYFKLTPKWDAKSNREFMQWAVAEQICPEQIQLAAQVWGKDRRFNWQHPNLKGIQEHWLQLIETATPDPSAPKRHKL